MDSESASSKFLPVTDEQFPMDAFLELEEERLHPEFSAAHPLIAHDGKLRFEPDKPSLFPFVLEVDGQVVGATYLRTLILPDHRIVIRRSTQFVVKRLVDVFNETYPPRVLGCPYILELGGSAMDQAFDGRGLYRRLFDQVLRYTRVGFESGRLVAYDERGSQLERRDLTLVISNIGRYRGDRKTKIFTEMSHLDEQQLRSVGINPDEIGMPRPESAAIAHIVRSHYLNGGDQRTRFEEIGADSNHLGPVFAALLE